MPVVTAEVVPVPPEVAFAVSPTTGAAFAVACSDPVVLEAVRA